MRERLVDGRQLRRYILCVQYMAVIGDAYGIPWRKSSLAVDGIRPKWLVTVLAGHCGLS